MILGIMQPYIFPYIGYFQLVNAVDKFVFYDDVNFIKQGWINRNRILVNNNAFLFSVPVKSISSYTPINEVQLDERSFSHWKPKFLKTLEGSYRKAPHYKQTMVFINSVLNASLSTIADIARNSVITISEYLGLNTIFVSSSSIYNNTQLKAQERVLDICLKEKASVYINASGGRELYSKEAFAEKSMHLQFISSRPVYYQQFSEPFIPHLSIIDVLMFNSKEVIGQFLTSYDLV